MFPIISLGPLSLPAPQLILLVGLWLGSSIAERQAKNAGRKSELLFKIIWTTILAGILGARLSYIARNPGAFQGQWLSIFSLNQALFDPMGGFLIACTTGYFVALRNQVANWALLDDLTPLFSILAPAIFLANFASGSGYGATTDAPWGIDLWGGHRHPVQLYYLIASLIVLSLVLSRRKLVEEISGISILLFFTLTFGYLIIISTFQDPARNLIAGFRVMQLASWIFFTISIIFYNRLKMKGVENAPD